MDFITGCLSSPRAAFAAFDPDAEEQHCHGLSDGTWSLIDGLRLLLQRLGPSQLVISTWTAAGADLEEAMRFFEDGRVTSLRLLIDGSFQSRKPKVTARAREIFGPDAVRVWRSHAKFCILVPEAGGGVLYLTSANLNPNPRMENWSLISAPAAVAAYLGMVDDIFATQPGGALWDVRPHVTGTKSYQRVVRDRDRAGGSEALRSARADGLEAEDLAEPEDLAALFRWPAIEAEAPPHLLAEYRRVAALCDETARRMAELLKEKGWVREDFDLFAAAQKQWQAGEPLKIKLGDQLARLAGGPGGISS